MRIIILIISMIISTISLALSQISGIYTIGNLTEKIDCNIYLFKNNSYYIELSENVTSDIIESLVLSYGKFSLTNNEVTLIDKVHNYKMQLILDNNVLIVKQAFGFITNKRFSCYSPNYHTGIPCSNINALFLQEERDKYKKAHIPLVPLNIGIFENEQGFKLNIQQNNKYELEFKSIILSEGEWCRDGNELELKDLNLEHSFYVLISDKMLISKLLLGDYKGLLLIKK